MKHTRLTPAIKQAFFNLDCQFSPENLSCDGELSAARTQARRKKLCAEWAALEKRIGMRVTPEMVYAWSNETL